MITLRVLSASRGEILFQSFPDQNSCDAFLSSYTKSAAWEPDFYYHADGPPPTPEEIAAIEAEKKTKKDAKDYLLDALATGVKDQKEAILQIIKFLGVK